ncbi:MAG: NADH-quinone oxidoreductase subunit C [Nitrososphaeraceae archaeon]
MNTINYDNNLNGLIIPKINDIYSSNFEDFYQLAESYLDSYIVSTFSDDISSQNVDSKTNNIKSTKKQKISNNNKVPNTLDNSDSNLEFENSILNQISSKFGEKIRLIFIQPKRIKIFVNPSDIIEVAKFLKEIGLDHAESVAGTDYPDENVIEVIYHLSSYSRVDLNSMIFALSTKTDRDDARLPTLIPIFNSVEYHERETFEMLGVYFEGHPRNERFLLPEDWADIPPLRKDFKIKGR